MKADTRPRLLLLLATLAASGWLMCACEARSAEDVRVDWQIAPAPATVGPSTLRFDLNDERRQPVTGAQLRVQGHMTHPGMAPTTADVRESAPGSYEADLEFTMAGDWVLVLEGTLADGRPLRHQLRVLGVGAKR